MEALLPELPSLTGRFLGRELRSPSAQLSVVAAEGMEVVCSRAQSSESLSPGLLRGLWMDLEWIAF